MVIDAPPATGGETSKSTTPKSPFGFTVAGPAWPEVAVAPSSAAATSNALRMSPPLTARLPRP
jgi:hypothetical protein